MKAIQPLLLFLLFIGYSTATAQINSAEDWNRDRLQRERSAMEVLSVWGSINIATGVTGYASTSDAQDLRWFSAMNAGFGLVNSTLGFVGLSRTTKQLKTLPSLEQGYKDLRRTRNILLVNVGLDVGYVITGILLYDGVLLNESGGFFNDRISIFRRRGFGTSLIVQGGALLLFDSITAWQLSKSQIHISPVLTSNGAGLGFQTNFEKEKPVGIAWF